MTALVVRGDARCLPLPDASVDLVVTSPPYWAQRSYTDGGVHYEGQIGDEATPAEYVAALIGCTREWLRVLKPSGSLFVNIADKYATSRRGPDGSSSGLTNGAQPRVAGAAPRFGVRHKSLVGLPSRYVLSCIDDLGLIWRRDIVWHKPNGLPSSADDRCRTTHEYLLHLVLRPDYYADLDPIREPHVGRVQPARPLGTRNATPYHSAATDNVGWKDHAVARHPAGRAPSSVWSIPTQPLRLPVHLAHIRHDAPFPRELPRRLILGWCPPGGVVLDPFGGTGTTALMASLLGRTGITVDRSADYCRIAQWRTAGLLGGAA